MSIIVDYSHTYRTVTGVEEIANRLFSPDALAGLPTRHIVASGAVSQIVAEWLVMPTLAALDRRAVFITPSFPPSLALQACTARIVPYVHDLFLLKNTSLNWRAKAYLRPSFLGMLKRCSTFFTNSRYTSDELRPYVARDADIYVYSPSIVNKFGLDYRHRGISTSLTLVSMGTVEPRKNLIFALRVVEYLNRSGLPTTLHVVGRPGWGNDWAILSQSPFVTLHGYLQPHEFRRLVAASDAFLFVSKDEGLGLPLLEVQFAGKPTFVSDIPVFRDTLGAAGVYLPLEDVAGSATIISSAFSLSGWVDSAKVSAMAAIRGHNDVASRQRDQAMEVIARLHQVPA